MPRDGVDIPPDSPPDEDLSPPELKDRVEATIDLSVSQLEGFRDSEFNKAYREQNSSQSQPGDEPLTDAIRLLETPADEWADKGDGFNEIQEAEELLNFHRSKGAAAKEQGLGENFLTEAEEVQKREAALIRWGDDPDGEIEW
jgi:hypothetical protein